MDGKRFLMIFLLLASALSMEPQTVLSLQDCRDLAIKNNKQLKINDQKIIKADYDKKAAATKYLPEFSFEGAYFYNSDNLHLLSSSAIPSSLNTSLISSLIPGFPTSVDISSLKKDIMDKTTMDIHNIWLASVNLVQPVFMGGKIKAYNEITGYAKDLAIAQKDAGIQDIILQTDEAYWTAVSLVSKEKLTDSYVEMLKKMDHDIEAMVEEGVATKADALSVKVKLNEAEMNQLKVEDGLRLSKMLLCQLCGLPVDGRISLKDEDNDSFPVESSPSHVDMNNVYENRPELKSLGFATKIYEKKERIAKSEFLPSVALLGNYTLMNPNLDDGFQKTFAGSWHVGLTLSYPIFHWGERSHNLNASRAETLITRLQTEDAKEKIELQVNKYVFEVNESEKKLTAAMKNMENANENLRYANVGFGEGVIPVLNVMEAQTAWVKAKSELIDAQIDNKLSNVYLKKAMGVLNDK